MEKQSPAKMIKKNIEAIADSANPEQLQMAAGPKGTERTDAQLRATELRAPGVVDEQFPTNALTSSDPRDRLISEKLQLSKDTPGVTPFGQLIASDSDFHWLQQKREKEAEANFQVMLLYLNVKIFG